MTNDELDSLMLRCVRASRGGIVLEDFAANNRVTERKALYAADRLAERDLVHVTTKCRREGWRLVHELEKP